MEGRNSGLNGDSWIAAGLGASSSEGGSGQWLVTCPLSPKKKLRLLEVLGSVWGMGSEEPNTSSEYQVFPRQGPARVWVGAGPEPGPCPAGGLWPHPRIAAAEPIQPLGRTRAAFPGPLLPPAVPPLTLPLPASVWPGLAAVAPTVAATAIGLRPAASPSPGSRRGAVSACVARGDVGWDCLCVRPRLDRTRSGAGCMEVGTRRPFPAGHRHPDPRSPLGFPGGPGGAGSAPAWPLPPWGLRPAGICGI